jgi:hypothetical protein
MTNGEVPRDFWIGFEQVVPAFGFVIGKELIGVTWKHHYCLKR